MLLINDTNSLKGIFINFIAIHDQMIFKKFLGQPSPELSYVDSSTIHIRRDVGWLFSFNLKKKNSVGEKITNIS